MRQLGILIGIISLVVLVGCNMDPSKNHPNLVKQNKAVKCNVVELKDSLEVTCPDNTHFIIPQNNDQVVVNVQSIKGDDGQDGTSCSVQRVSDGTLISCSDGTSSMVYDGQSIKGDKGDSCNVQQVVGGSRITCQDGTSSFIRDGINGVDGIGCNVERIDNGSRITCGSTISYIFDGVKGDQGEQGQNGLNGQSCSVVTNPLGALVTCGIEQVQINNGINGQSCSVQQMVNGVMIQCGYNQAVILNGVDGVNSPFSIKTIYEPCGHRNGIFNESILELENGTFLAYFEQGNNRFLGVLDNGSYQTTDGKACHFVINANGINW